MNGKKPAGIGKHLKFSPQAARTKWQARHDKLAPNDRANWSKRVQAARERRVLKKGKKLRKGKPAAKADEVAGDPFFESDLNAAPASGAGEEPPINPAVNNVPVIGNFVGLTIIVQFPDDPEVAGDAPTNFPTTNAKIERYCNEVGYNDDGNTGSILDYFFDQSLGATTYTQVVTEIVTLPHPRDYYNWENYPTNSTIRDGGLTGRLVLNDALTILQNDGFDFSALTLNASDRVVATNVMFAGANSGVWPDGLWPHRWALSYPGVNVGTTANPIKIYDYQITNASNAAVKIGTFCHENGHLLLKYPDLYDYDGDSRGLGSHGLMAGGNSNNGGRTPAPINGYFKDVSGWSNVVDITASQLLATSLSTTNNEGYSISKPGTNTEYFFIENRGIGDPWAASVPDKGIIIWHVDETVNGNNDQQMTLSQHYEVSVEQADGAFDLENNRDSGDSADLFDSTHTSGFNDNTSPNANWWDGSDSGIEIAFLSSPGASMDVRFGASGPDSYIVTYSGNVNTGGSPPTDNNEYNSGATVTVLGNTGDLTKTGHTFDDWNTAANGTGTSYSSSNTFSMGTSNVTLYAQWKDPTPPNPNPMTWATAPAPATTIQSSAVILNTDFTNRSISEAIASNITWATNGVADAANLTTTGSFTLFDTAAAQGCFSPDRNVGNEGPWTTLVPLNLITSAISIDDVVLVYKHFNNSGNAQSANRTVNWAVSVTGSLSGLIGSKDVAGISSTSGTVTATFTPALELNSGETYSLSITASATSSGNNTGLNELTVNGEVGVSGDPETEVSMTASSASDVNGVEYYFTETSGNPGGSDSGWQDSPSYIDIGLNPATQYTYTVVARDKSPQQNTTGASDPASATTDGVGPLDHFAISAIGATQTVGVPINGITITAQDAFNNTITSFTSTVAYGGSAGITGTSANFVDGVLGGVSLTPTLVGSNRTLTVTDGSSHDGLSAFKVQSAYDNWSSGSFVNSFIDIDSNSNPDGDGLSNLQEFAFGTDPTLNDSVSMKEDGSVHGLPIPVLSDDGITFELLFLRRKDHGTSGSVTYIPQFSDDLSNFTASVVPPSVTVVNAANPAYEVVKVTYPVGTLFGRIKVNLVP